MYKYLQFKERIAKFTKYFSLLFLAIMLLLPIESYSINGNNKSVLLIQQIETIKVSVNIDNSSIEDILVAICEKADIQYTIRKDVSLDKQHIYSLNVDNLTVKEVLNSFLLKTKYDYNVNNEKILIINRVEKNKQQIPEKIELKGKVVDGEKNPIIGATLIVTGTTTGAISDGKGEFILSMNAGQELEISFTGYFTKKQTFQTSVDNLIISLEVDNINIEDVIITGYQTITKERATGSFATLNAKSMEGKLQPDLNSMIEGQVAGLVRDKEGNISIRGTSTLSAESKPLIVLDGYPFDGTLSDINPDNIENITILKDGVSASIYGSRAANGVIVVTSKKGKSGKFVISYKGVLSTTMKADFNDFLHGSTSDYIDGEIALYETAKHGSNTSFNTPVTQYLVDAFNKTQNDPANKAKYDAFAMSEIDKLRGNDAYKDLEEFVHRATLTHTHTLSINGGSEQNLFNASVNYRDEKGNMVHQNNDRFMFDMKNIWKPRDWLTFDVAANVTLSNNESPTADFKSMMGFYGGLTPYYDLYDDNGNPLDIASPTAQSTINLYNNTPGTLPYNYNYGEDLARQMNYNNSMKVRLVANLTFKLMDGLTFTTGGSMEKGSYIDKTISEKESFYVRNIVNYATDKDNTIIKYLPYGDIVNESRNTRDAWTIRSQFNLNKSFNDHKHRVTAILGNEVRRDQYDYNHFSTRVGVNQTAGSFANMNIKDWNGRVDRAKMLAPPASWAMFNMSNGYTALRDNRFVSWYGNASYEYDSKYIISGSMRMDLTNFFGTDAEHRYKPLWSVGGTWKLSQENFFDVDFIDRLNVRASYGVNGNISMNQGPFLILGVGEYSDITEGTEYSIASPPNNQLRWEKTATTNVGFDLSILNNRINFTLDAYNKLSTDLLAADAIDQSTGFKELTKNVGSIKNRGIEISINANIIEKKSFVWNTNFNFSYNKNMVVEYNVNRPWVGDWTNIRQNAEGYPVGSYFSFRYAGLNDTGACLGYNQAGEEVLLTAAIADDLVHSGTAIPPFDLSWTNSFSYKQFDFSFMFVAKLGAVFRADSFSGSNYNNRNYKDSWKADDKSDKIYPGFGSNQRWVMPYTDILITSADYLKLRDLSLSYRLPKTVLKKLGLSSARLYVQARNLFTITANDLGIDPESLGGFNVEMNSANVDLPNIVFPVTPEFHFGVSFSF